METEEAAKGQIFYQSTLIHIKYYTFLNTQIATQIPKGCYSHICNKGRITEPSCEKCCSSDFLQLTLANEVMPICADMAQMFIWILWGVHPNIWTVVNVWPITCPTPRPVCYGVQWCRYYCASQKLLALQCEGVTSWCTSFKTKNLYIIPVFRKKLLRRHFNSGDSESCILLTGKELHRY